MRAAQHLEQTHQAASPDILAENAVATALRPQSVRMRHLGLSGDKTLQYLLEGGIRFRAVNGVHHLAIAENLTVGTLVTPYWWAI